MVSWLTFEPFHVSALNQPLLLGDLAPSLERLRDLYLSMRHSHCPCSHCFQASQQSRKHNVCVFSRVWLFVTPWTAVCQALLSMRFFRQEYWSGLPFPPPQNLPDPGIEPTSLALAGGFFTTDPPGKPQRKNTLNHTCTHSCVSIFFCYVFLNPWFKVILLIPRITGFILAFNLSLFTIFLHKWETQLPVSKSICLSVWFFKIHGFRTANLLTPLWKPQIMNSSSCLQPYNTESKYAFVQNQIRSFFLILFSVVMLFTCNTIRLTTSVSTNILAGFNCLITFEVCTRYVNHYYGSKRVIKEL